MHVNADSLLTRAATTSTSGTFNDLTTDLIIVNNNNNSVFFKLSILCYNFNVTNLNLIFLCFIYVN